MLSLNYHQLSESKSCSLRVGAVLRYRSDADIFPAAHLEKLTFQSNQHKWKRFILI